MSELIAIGPTEFVHILDITTNITHLELGPKRLMLKANQRKVAGPLPCIIIPPGHYCTIKDPIKKYKPGEPCELKHGHKEVQFHQEPFPLYPGESLEGAESLLAVGISKAIKPLPVVKANQAIRLIAQVDHTSPEGVKRYAGDEWQYHGPLTYKPTAEAKIVRFVDAVVLTSGEALHLTAKRELIDSKGVKREVQEEWLVREEGAYLPGIYEEVVKVVQPFRLTPTTGLHLKTTHSCKDALGRERSAGEEWLVTDKDTDSYVPEIGEEVICMVSKTVLQKGQYCVVKNPVDTTGKPQYGKLKLLKGIASFFLHPGEIIEEGIKSQYVLGEDEALVLECVENFTDDAVPGGKVRKPGDRWMIRGPKSYIPPTQVKELDQGNSQVIRKAIPLGENEGIYIRNLQSGEVKVIMGPKSYLLNEHEKLWEKELDPLVVSILKKGGGCGEGDIRKLAYFEQSIDSEYTGNKPRDKTRAVRYRCPHNTAVQVYEYQKKTARVVFGPDMTILGPHEDFNVLSLSAGKPKVENALKTICLMLGPDYITDILEVETADHARLKIKIAFNNHFEFERGNLKEESSIFSVPDFIGFACREVGSRIRGAVSRVKFDEFHRHSMELLKTGVFGLNPDKTSKDRLVFNANKLVITNVDIQAIEPVDSTMRNSLLKSVQMAIEIATQSIQRTAGQDAACKEQEAQGQLERQKLTNEQENEKARTVLHELRASASAVESCGQAKAEAQAQAERLLIEGHSAIESARLKAEAEDILCNSELGSTQMARLSELNFLREQNELEIGRTKQLADIEVGKFAEMVKALGAETIMEMANAGPKLQVELLSSLGLETTVFTDGNSPINLFNVAQGLIAQPAQSKSA
ncbi:major vault protein-like [Lytechinus pictus]|uniref:major vault protein-like n=1 Tax=Lytechinus pictus TaxID=7653 RepID=UPI0030B9F4AC